MCELRENEKDKKTQRQKDIVVDNWRVIHNFMIFKIWIVAVYREILYICTAQVKGRKTTGGSARKLRKTDPFCEK